jgi:hypothetical protein
MTTSTTPDADYAFWAIPGTSSKVTYSLGTFHEIDFVVNEGYRRIPHGGIEMAGLLFGRANEEGVRIESFRPIECEHASGPSFNLSEKDIAALEKQISSAASDPELNGLEVMGWFIAHTRGPLKLTEKEKLLFDRFFPGPNKLTVLIKPERFHPTRFGFLIREKEGQMNTDATASAIILPGRGTQGREGPVPSIAAPPETSDGRQSERTSTETTSKRAIPLREPPPELHLPPRAPQPVGQPTAPAVTPDILAPEIENAPVSAVVHTPAAIVRSLPVERVSPPPVAPRSLPEIEPPRARRRATALADDRKAYGFQFALVLLIAAFLGCCVGYWAYLQLPSAVIPLAIQKQQNTLIVSWSPSQTRTSAYAAVRVDDGEPVMLSSAEKIAGRTTVVSTANDVKVELIAQHWLRDSRGIVRFVSGAQNVPSAAPTAPNLKPGSSGSAAGSQLP